MDYLKRKFMDLFYELHGEKELVMDGGANHFMGIEGVGGWLYLTPDELIFISHSFNIQTHQTIIPLNQIVEAKATLTAGIIPNGLTIITKHGAPERFVVYNRNAWANRINETIFQNF